MFQATRFAPLRFSTRVSQYVQFSSTSGKRSLANAPLNLDPSLQALLRDVDVSLDMTLQKNRNKSPHTHRELEVVSLESTGVQPSILVEEWSPMEMTDEEFGQGVERESRKSPAALFGSSQIGSVVIPLELQSSINRLISDSQKPLLHSDAKRLFHASDSQDEKEPNWDTNYDTQYRTKEQASRHGIRDGTAFASVALPPHFAAITAVLHHAKLRLDDCLEVDRVIEWGAGTGSGLWASLHSFQEHNSDTENDPLESSAATSKLKSYLGIDKREGLVTIAKRLIAHAPTGGLNIRWQKSFKEDNKLLEEDARKTIALSAFVLTTLPGAMAQKAMIQEMWDSGAHTIVLIDHNSAEGFRAVAHSREYILELGKLENEDLELSSSRLQGSHVVAPCPHDGLCPLLHSGGTPLICGFSQRLQRPTFLQRTKHSGIGHEDIQYSYVVIRRGPRPESVATSVGRIGGIGRQVLEKQLWDAPMKELEVHTESEAPAELTTTFEELNLQTRPAIEPTGPELQSQLRKEAYQWPRLVFPPLKKSGHIILDTCTAEGKIMRMTIPKSQGKQSFYDARKSHWGDLFPHPPKNRALERYQPKTQRKGEAPATGGDIGKRRDQDKKRERASYNALGEGLKERKKMSKREYAKIRGDKIWQDMPQD